MVFGCERHAHGTAGRSAESLRPLRRVVALRVENNVSAVVLLLVPVYPSAVARTDAPTGTVTFLFTDIEGSTRRWNDHGEAMKDAVERHDSMVRSAITGRDGFVFTTAGDSFAAAFAEAGAAVDAARSIQTRLAAEDFDAVDGLRVRIGLHTGLATVRDGDYFGPDVAVAARLTAAGHGGQVVLSGGTAALVPDDTRSLGEHRLRDVPEPVTLHQLLGDDLDDDFEPLRTVEGARVSLPAQRSSFVGRADELREVVKLLENSSLVTLTGTGGTGKTRLAIETAAEVAPRVEGDIVFVDLSTTTDLDEINTSLATALGVTLDSSTSVRQQLIERVRSRIALLIVDNCEHLLDEVADLVDDLAELPSVKVLLTSRELLDVEGERVFRVPPLGATDDRAAVRLFVDRALTAEPDLDVDAEVSEVIAEICQRLDGIPLAIELAASRARVLSLVEIRDRLSDRFSLLTGGRRRGRQRQQTLESTIGWSYDLLEPDEQTAFRSLGVFASSFDLEAAAVVMGMSAGATIDLLDGLVAKSLLVRLAGDRSRFRLLETMRAYAETKLTEEGETEATRDRHLEHYVASVSGRTALWSATPAVYDQHTVDFDNLLQALDWAMVRGRSADGTKLVGAAALSVNRGYVELVRNRVDSVLELELGRVDQAALRLMSAWVAILTREPRSWADVVAARELLDRAGADAPADLVVPAQAWQCFIATSSRGRADRGGARSLDVEAAFAEIDSRLDEMSSFMQAECHMAVALVRCYDLRWVDVVERVERAAAAYGDAARPIIADSVLTECEVYGRLALGNVDAAIAAAERHLAESDRPGLWSLLTSVAHVHALAAAGRVDEAARRLLTAAERESSLTISGVRATLMLGCSALRLARGDVEVALDQLVVTAPVARSPGSGFYAMQLIADRAPERLREVTVAGGRETSDVVAAVRESEARSTAELEAELDHVRRSLG